MSIREIEFKSYNGRDTINGWIYVPACKPKAIVQIIHGFGEHSRRYLHMVTTMLNAGFVVCADDHAGHGKTAKENGDTWGDGGDKGYKTYIEDEHSLRELVSKEFPGLPYFIFGHSWGSMIARSYLTEHAKGLKGAILCGTTGMRPEVKEVWERGAKYIKAGGGNTRDGELLGILLGNFNNRYENVSTPGDWIALEQGVVQDHAADPFNSFNPPTAYFMYDFTDLWIDISSKDWAAKVPKDVPLYFIAGDQDPVGNFGEGVYQTANWLWDSGHRKVKTVIYSGYRHEIHNEPPIRDEVEAGIIDFINANI